MNRLSIFAAALALYIGLACTPAADPAPASTDAPLVLAVPVPPAEIATVTADALHLRNAPNGDVIGWLRAGETVTIIARQQDWCNVGAGWVACRWVTR
jgi:hypothetical protein